MTTFCNVAVHVTSCATMLLDTALRQAGKNLVLRTVIFQDILESVKVLLCVC